MIKRLGSAPSLLASTAGIAIAMALMNVGTYSFQMVAARLLGDRESLWDAQRTRLRAQRDALAAALAMRLPDWSFRLPRGGLSLWVELPEHAPRFRLLVKGAELASPDEIARNPRATPVRLRAAERIREAA